MGSVVLSSTMDHDIKCSILASFLQITAVQSVETAKQFLDATTWKLDEAIHLFFLRETIEDSSSGSCSSSSQVNPPLMENQNNHEPDLSGSWKDEDQVSALLPVRKEALYGDGYNEKQREDDEMMFIPSEGDQIWEESDSLGSMYRPPLELMFKGSFEKAKQVALKEGKWVLLNLQSKKEFNSYMLNRDTWSNEGVAQIIKKNFIFLQVYDDTTEGMKISTFYNLLGSIPPVVLLLDPITGQKMWGWNGMIEGERLMEELFPFMDTGIKGLHPNQPVKSTDQRSYVNEEELDEEMVLALAASMEGLMNDDDDASTNEPPMMYEESSSDEEDNCLMEEKKITYPALPEDPQTADRNLVCRIGFRLPPDGRRVQRSFFRTDPIQLLWSFISSQFSEVERNRPFKLTVPQGILGAASKALDYESKVSFEESGLSNSMILVTWND